MVIELSGVNIRSVIIRSNHNKIGRAAGIRFVYHKNYNFREIKNGLVIKEMENLHLRTDRGAVNCEISL